MTLVDQPVFSGQGILKCQGGFIFVFGREMSVLKGSLRSPPMRLPADRTQRSHKDKRGGRAGYFGDAELVDPGSEFSKSHLTKRAALRGGSFAIGDAA